MPIAEGLTLKFEDESSIKEDYLETIEYTGNDQNITYETDELSAVCPFSGLPDYAKLDIEYIPTNKIVELKSLKYYLISYRNIGIYQEALTNRIYNDLFKVLEPKFLKITTKYNVRGGILAACIMDSDKIS